MIDNRVRTEARPDLCLEAGFRGREPLEERPMSVYSERYNVALRLAARAHAGQMRKGTDVPYLVHPVHVARILEAHGFDEDIVLAGLLHDTLEDTALTLDEIARVAGTRVASLVREVTEDKRDESGERPWEVRKNEQLERLARADREVAALKAADSLHNVRETIEEARAHGVALVFRRFKRGPEVSLAHHREVARIVRQRLGDDHALARELEAAVDQLAALTGSSG